VTGFPSPLPPDLPPDYPSLSQGERAEIVSEIAKPRPAGDTIRARIVETHESGERTHEPALTLVLEFDPDPRVKRTAAFGLACIPDRAAVPGLRMALGLPDRATKTHAIFALGRLRAREALPELVALLDDWYTCMSAADALVAIGDDRALPALSRAAGHGLPLRRRRLRKRVRLMESGAGVESPANAG